MNFIELFKKALPKPLFRPIKPRTTKHEASKRGYRHKRSQEAPNHRAPIFTQHQRVVLSRAARLGISVKEYEMRYPKSS